MATFSSRKVQNRAEQDPQATHFRSQLIIARLRTVIQYTVGNCRRSATGEADGTWDAALLRKHNQTSKDAVSPISNTGPKDSITLLIGHIYFCFTRLRCQWYYKMSFTSRFITPANLACVSSGSPAHRIQIPQESRAAYMET